MTGDGLRDPDGSRRGGGRISYPGVLESPDNAAGGRLGAKTAFVIQNGLITQWRRVIDIGEGGNQGPVV